MYNRNVYFKTPVEHNIAPLETAIRALTQFEERNRRNRQPSVIPSMIAILESGRRELLFFRDV